MKIIAHRGASFYEPENTIRAIKRAIESKADFVEVDVRRSKDKELVIMHDAEITRTTNGNGLVKHKTLKELKKFDAGQGEEIPTLDEVVMFVKNRVGLVIEIKEVGTEEEIVKNIAENNINDVILTSFYHETIKNVSKLNSDLDTGIIFVGQPVSVHKLAFDANASIIFPSYRYMNEEMVKQAKEHGITVYPWAIDDFSIFEKFAKMGVDGVVTNKLLNQR
ncbi:glycerophosphodiester phosphodiesterase [Methanobacterium oryzae]|uniref:glycerophosphodiester phosphodiesterase n=1 Tax=Methanobacterium oryzae TaxID=69540 RepID=UPI003D1E7810